ncbi:MAG: alpha/beta hydrolase [Rhodocyclaceae bacterium]|nr:alpha/beta hydrolase [Rhodocyclaceae bacterium]MBX3670317.1 alpha/beta hydrolase [Rhodocyclaceae bacterium]
MYRPRLEARSIFADLRGVRHHFRCWGERDAPLIVMLHGWMDLSASFQFIVDALARPYRVIAPDWRGFGLSERNGGTYWFPDYLADLDCLLQNLSPDAAVDLVGHSMGANVAGLYAGIRPRRVRRVVSLEGFGLGESHPRQAPGRYGQWLAELASPPTLRDYADREALALRLQSDNPRLPADRAQFLAQHLGRDNAKGRVDFAADPRHRVVNPMLYRLEETKACWRATSAPCLWIAGRDSRYLAHFLPRANEVEERLACLPDARLVWLEHCGHNMHHEKPQEVAQLIESFLHAD